MARDAWILARRWAVRLLLVAAFAAYLASVFFEWHTVAYVALGSMWLLLGVGLIARVVRGRHVPASSSDRSVPSDPLQDVIGGRKPSDYAHDADTTSQIGAAPQPDPLHLPARPD